MPNLNFTKRSVPETDTPICFGYRFIAERGGSGQLTHIDKIDQAYKLAPLPKGLLAQLGQAPPVPVFNPQKALTTPSYVPRLVE